MASKLQKSKKEYKQNFNTQKEWALIVTIKGKNSEKEINLVIPIWG